MKLKWTVFLSISNTPASRVLQRVGGRNPSDASTRIHRAFRAGLIDRDSYETRLAMLDELIQAWDDCHYEADCHPASDWEYLPNGAYRRREHRGSAS